MNSSTNLTQVNILMPQDTGWSKFWIIFSSLALILFAFVPEVKTVQENTTSSAIPTESLNWIWDSFSLNFEILYKQSGIYLALFTGIMVLLSLKLFKGKIAITLALSLVILQFLLFSMLVLPQLESLKPVLRQLGILYFMISVSVLLIGSHLQKTLPYHWYPQLLLLIGGILVSAGLFLPITWPVGGSSLLNLLQPAAWKGHLLPFSIALTLSFLVALAAVASVFISTQKIMSFLTRMVFISAPAVLYFYFAESKQFSVLHSIVETIRYCFLLLGVLALPVCIATLLELNTPVENDATRY